ncbi:MAG: ParB/RepB/Spo0J family partition protein [bacterium]|nr:ParB/RepB/Spo0J family partition protein [bacterium]
MPHTGFGLESLIPQKKIKSDDDYSVRKEAIFFIETDKIKANPFQPRKEFNNEALKALSESIKQHGILQPLVVSRIESNGVNVGYQLIAGERRLLASKMAGFKQVPVIIREPGDREKLVLSLIENIQREDLNAMEKAGAYKKLQGDFNLLQKDIAHLVGKSKETVSNTLRLLELPEKIKQALKKSIISEGHAKALLSISDGKTLQEVFNKIVKENLSVRDAEIICYGLRRKESTQEPIKKAKTGGIAVINEKIKSSLDKFPGIFKFKFKNYNGKPAITIYFDNDSKFNNFLGIFRD